MKIILQDKRRYMLRFDKDEDVIAGLIDFMKTQFIFGCSFTGIGACSSADLGYYNVHNKEYRRKPYIDDMEVLSLIGTGGVKDGVPVIHAHAVFSKNDFTTMGGHVFALVVSATCEVMLTKLDGDLNRQLDAGLNLNLLV